MKTKKPKLGDNGKEKTINIMQVLNLDDEKNYELVAGKVLVEEIAKAGLGKGDALSIEKIDKALYSF